MLDHPRKLKTFTYCSFCDRAIEFQNPPAEEEYERGLIEIKFLSILLSKELAKKNKGAHAHMIENEIFCDYKCLFKYILKKLGIDVVEFETKNGKERIIL